MANLFALTFLQFQSCAIHNIDPILQPSQASDQLTRNSKTCRASFWKMISNSSGSSWLNKRAQLYIIIRPIGFMEY